MIYFMERFKISKNTLFKILRLMIILYLITLVSIQISSMKKSLDQLYSNSFLAISELNKANKIYHVNIKNNLYQVLNLNITPTQALLDMKNSLPIVEKIWKDYEKNFQYGDKVEYLEYALSEIETINHYFNEINIWCSNIEQMQMLSLRDIDKKIAKANIIIQELINYELQIAQQKRLSVLEKFKTFIYQIIFLLFIMMLFIVHYIYQMNIKQLLLKKELQKITSNYELLETLEYNDSLTSLYNRRYFNHIYKEELEIAKKDKKCITLIMVDIDCFKEYNSLYGYAKGDELLILIADILKDISDTNSFIFRFNGEAFVILLTQADENRSIEFTKSISKTIREQKIEHKGSKTDNILTVSVGMAYSFIDDLTNEYSLISDADKMLSIAKENGRDRTEIHKGKEKNEQLKLIDG